MLAHQADEEELTVDTGGDEVKGPLSHEGGDRDERDDDEQREQHARDEGGYLRRLASRERGHDADEHDRDDVLDDQDGDRREGDPGKEARAAEKGEPHRRRRESRGGGKDERRSPRESEERRADAHHGGHGQDLPCPDDEGDAEVRAELPQRELEAHGEQQERDPHLRREARVVRVVDELEPRWSDGRAGRDVAGDLRQPQEAGDDCSGEGSGHDGERDAAGIAAGSCEKHHLHGESLTVRVASLDLDVGSASTPPATYRPWPASR